MFELLDDLDLNALESAFETKEERAIIFRQLAEIKHPVVDSYLSRLAEGLLDFAKNPTNNDTVFANLDLLGEYFFRVPEQAIEIIRAIVMSKKPLDSVAHIHEFWGRIEGKSHEDLIIKCIELLDNLRYFKTKRVFGLLLKLSQQESVKAKAVEALVNLCKYNLFALQKIGYRPQRFILGEVEGWSDRKLRANMELALKICDQFVQPSFEGQSMSDYKTFNIHYGPLEVSADLKDIRRRSADLLKKLYGLTRDQSEKEQVLQTLSGLAQMPFRANYGKDLEQMVIDDTNALIDYYIDILPGVKSEVIKVIEQQLHWFVPIFDKEALPRANELQSTIDTNDDYSVFRLLVGYEPRFIEDLGWEKAAEIRGKKIQELVVDVSEENFGGWRDKLSSIAKSYSPSDPSEFQYFSVFLSELGKENPDLALELIKQKEEEFEPFLVHLVAGIWKSNSREFAKSILSRWVDEQKHLSICVWVFNRVGEIDKALFEDIFRQAKVARDMQALSSIIRVILGNHSSHGNLKPMFMDAIQELTKDNDWSWIRGVWHQEASVLESFTKEDFRDLLEYLILVPKIDHSVERIICPIAERYPEEVIAYFQKRVAIRAKEKEIGHYDAVPYRMPIIGESLRKHPAVVVDKLLKWFPKRKGLPSWEINYLLRSIFPSFDRELEQALIMLIRSKNKENMETVFSVLHAYEGEQFLHSVCKALIKRYHRNQYYRNKLFGILSWIDFVSGEYGLVEVYKRKKEEVQYWRKDNSRSIHAFVEAYEDYLDKQIEYEKKRADERIELMKRNIR